MLEITCDKCGTVLPLSPAMRPDELRCSACRARQSIIVMAAINRDPEQGRPAEKAIADEATCFNHPDKKAQTVCDSCGAYLCGLCDINLDSSHFCPKCFQEQQRNMVSFKQEAVLYDNIALGLALLPTFFLFLWPILPLFSIAVIIYVVIYGKKMATPYRRRKWRFWVATIVALLQLTAFAMLILA